MMLAFAALPTVIDPSAAMFTTLAVVRSPYAFGSTSTRRLRAIATHELLVPRSMPIAISAMDSPPHCSVLIGRWRGRLENRSSPWTVVGPVLNPFCFRGVAYVRPLSVVHDQAEEGS